MNYLFVKTGNYNRSFLALDSVIYLLGFMFPVLEMIGIVFNLGSKPRIFKPLFNRFSLALSF